MTAFTTRTVSSGGVELACRDYAGLGPDLVLMHGAGMTQASLTRVIDHLAGYRVVTFDFRGHGETPMAEWTLDTAVSDLEAVIGSYGLSRPAVGGHSLGGMVAVEYARQHPECPAAVNIDGHGMGVPEQYVGKDPALVAAWQRECRARAAKLTQGPVMKVAGLVGRLAGKKPVDPVAVSAITSLVDELDLVRMYGEVAGPLQVFNAYAPTTGLSARVLKDPDGYFAAYRDGIRRDLTALAELKPGLVLSELDATHMLILTHPQQTAELLSTFLQGALSAR